MKIEKRYIDHNFGYRSKDAVIEWIVVHYAGIAGAFGRADIVARSLARASKTDCDTRLKRAASTHYIVGDDTVIQLVRERHKAWHVGGYSSQSKCGACNGNSIGVDLVERKISTLCKSVECRDWYFSEKVFDVGAQLIADIADRYNIDGSHIVRHYDVTGKLCPRPFAGKDISEYNGFSFDEMWSRFKERIAFYRKFKK